MSRGTHSLDETILESFFTMQENVDTFSEIWKKLTGSMSKKSIYINLNIKDKGSIEASITDWLENHPLRRERPLKRPQNWTAVRFDKAQIPEKLKFIIADIKMKAVVNP